MFQRANHCIQKKFKLKDCLIWMKDFLNMKDFSNSKLRNGKKDLYGSFKMEKCFFTFQVANYNFKQLTSSYCQALS